jgi:hypothetical protein
MDIIKDELNHYYSVNTLASKFKETDIAFIKIIAECGNDEDKIRTSVRNFIYLEGQAENALYGQFIKFNTLKMGLIESYIKYVATIVHPTIYPLKIVNEIVDAHGYVLSREDIRDYIREKSIPIA